MNACFSFYFFVFLRCVVKKKVIDLPRGERMKDQRLVAIYSPKKGGEVS